MDKNSLTLEEIAELTSCTLEGKGDVRIFDVDSLEAAGPESAAFLSSPHHEKRLLESKAGAIFVSPKTQRKVAEQNYLVAEDPSLAFQTLMEALRRPRQVESAFTIGIHPTVVLAKDAEVDPTATLGPYVVVDSGARVEAGAHISAHCFIGAGAHIGKDSFLHPSVVVREGCILGERVICQPGAVIGACGFGYHSDKQTGQHTKLEQLGIVVIEDDVEIGAQACIDRARFKETRVKRGTKIDNLVQIGHNCTIGKHNILCGQTGLAGSVELEDHVTLAGQVAVAGHIKLSKGVTVAGRGAVIKSLTKPGAYAGVPATPYKEQYRTQLHIRALPKFSEKLSELEKRLEALEKE